MKIRELVKNGFSINLSDYSVKVLKLTKKLQHLLGPVKLKDFKLQSISGLVDEASRL